MKALLRRSAPVAVPDWEKSALPVGCELASGAPYVEYDCTLPMPPAKSHTILQRKNTSLFHCFTATNKIDKIRNTRVISAGEMYSMICVELAADHFNLSLTFDEDMTRKPFLHFCSQ